MLARDLKIRTIKQQKEFIKRQLGYCIKPDGDTSYRYVGYLYPEVKKYFEEEGFKITPIEGDLINTVFQGLPVHLFTPSDDIVLSDTELAQAEEIELMPFTNDDGEDEEYYDDDDIYDDYDDDNGDDDGFENIFGKFYE